MKGANEKERQKKEAKDTPFKRTERTYTHRDVHRGTPALKRLDDKLGRTIRITRVRSGRNPFKGYYGQT